jgi:hypothetical protein
MKTALLVGLLTLCSLTGLSQGTVNFSNATSTYGTNTPDHLLRFSSTTVQIDPALPGSLVASNTGGVNLTGLRAQLFYGASTVNNIFSLTAVTDAPATFRASTSANAGAWLGGTRTLFGFNPGDTVHLNVVVWDIRFSTDPLQSLANYGNGGLFGLSWIFNYTIPAAGSPPSAYLPSGQLPFAIPYPGIIPEPASLTLVGLGSLALLFWRKKE